MFVCFLVSYSTFNKITKTTEILSCFHTETQSTYKYHSRRVHGEMRPIPDGMTFDLGESKKDTNKATQTPTTDDGVDF